MEKELLKRYFDNDVTPKERELVSQWLKDPLNHKEILDFIEAYWKEGDIQDAQVASFNKLFEKAILEEKNTGRGEAVVKPLPARKWFWMASAAACILFLIAGTWMGYRLERPDETDNWVLATASTGKGQRTRLLLSDGSEVYLNPESKITFPKNMDTHPEVYLEGEANFNFKNNKQPVVIKTKELVTTVKGSKCNISAFPKDSTVVISVEKGKAEITSNEGFGALLKLRIPSKDSTKTQEKKDTVPKFMPLIKLRPVVVKEKESMVFDKTSNKIDIEPCTGCMDK